MTMNATAPNITPFPKAAQPKARKVPVHVRRMRQQAIAGTAICVVAITLMCLSLAHLASGIAIVTNAHAWEAWALAVGIDMGFIGLEFAGLAAANARTRNAIARWHWAVLVLIALSAVLNAFAFAWQAVGWMRIPAVALGVAVPTFVYVLTRVGAVMWIEHRKE